MALAETELFFGDASPLHHAVEFGGPVYEVRAQQVEMACHCASAFDCGTQLCIEAPTGIGKTFAYLVPAYYHSIATKQPVVISTNTINLQEQIIHKDVPLLSKLINRNIDCRIAKGRGNYLCLYRLNSAKEHLGTAPLPGTPEAKLFEWAEKTEEGDRNELSIPGLNALWSIYNCSRDNCIGANLCKYKRECFMQKARNALKQAQIIVSNHAFLFSALTCDDLLPTFSGLVLDEAHTMPDIAADQLGVHVDLQEVSHALRKIVAESSHTGALANAESAEVIATAKALYNNLGEYVPRIVEYIRANAKEKSEKLVRIYEPVPNGGGLAVPIRDLGEAIKRISNHCVNDDPERSKLLRKTSDNLLEIADNLQTFFAVDEPEWAYWMELAGRDGTNVVCNAVPINPAQQLRPLLFNTEVPLPVIITSATLAVSGSLKYFKQRIGADAAEEAILTTPFNYEEQVTLYIPPMPEPTSPQYSDELNRQIKHYLEETDGHAFVLFTSYQQLKQSAEALRGFFKKNDYPLFLQGGELTPRQMLQEFRKSDRAVLFGTDSFWTGVDVPGDALSNVIITKLPFQTPGHPLMQKREELCRAANRSVFRDFSLPEAVLKFRQGFGRLIRTRTDKGIIVLLDNRLTSKNYGQSFLRSIPKCRLGECN
jgi:ATP-dependent DNA helicase DinG